jgi:hypothetical protein
VSRRLADSWVPPLTPEWDGSHLIRLWLMLRDEYAFWPWFDKSPEATCAVDAPTAWKELHARVTDILRSLPTYHRFSEAALRYDWKTAYGRVRTRSVIATTARDPRRPYIEVALRTAGVSDVAVLPSALRSKARAISQLVR